MHIHRSSRFPRALIVAAASLCPGTYADAGSLEADVEHRAAQVEKAKQDFDEASAAFDRCPARDQIAAVKARYALQQWQLLRDAESRKEQAESLLAAQRRLMAETQQEIAHIVARTPEIRKLQDAGTQATQVGGPDPDVRRRVADVLQAVQKHDAVRSRLDRLRVSEAALKDRIASLQSLVASQKDPQVRQYNQGLLARAETMHKDLGRTLAEIEKDDAQTKARAAELTGQQDEAAMRAAAERLKARWNRASRYQADVAGLLRGLTELGTTATVSSQGAVAIRRAGQDLRPIARGQTPTLLPGDTIITGANSHAELLLPDGSRIALQGNSQFTLDPEGGHHTAGTLKQGLMRLNELCNRRYKVRTPTVAVAVRGTDFIVTAEHGQTRCLVSSGEIEVTVGERSVPVRAGEQITLGGEQEDTKARPLTPGDFERLADELTPDLR